MKCLSYKLFFGAFGNKTRIQIVKALMGGPKSVTQICNITNEEQSKVSHNLKKLTNCHFLEVKRIGKERIYSLNKDTVVPIMQLVHEHVKKYCKEDCHLK